MTPKVYIPKKGFTIIEVLVVIGIIAVLVAAAVPMYNRARAKSLDTRIINTWKEACERLATFRHSGGNINDPSLGGIDSWIVHEGFTKGEGYTPNTVNSCWGGNPDASHNNWCLSTASDMLQNEAVGNIEIPAGQRGYCYFPIDSNIMQYKADKRKAI